jgi:hypothetical protein
LRTLLNADPLATISEQICIQIWDLAYTHLLSSTIYCSNKERMVNICDEKERDCRYSPFFIDRGRKKTEGINQIFLLAYTIDNL